MLEDAIRTGINSTEYFAIAAARNNERFIDLKYNQYVGIIANSDYLVKIVVALKQIASAQSHKPVTSPATPPVGESTSPNPREGESAGKPASEQSQPERPKNTRFYMSAALDNTRINRDVQKLVEEVISHLTSVNGCNVEVSLEVNLEAPDSLSQPTVRMVSENCRTLRVREFGFDE